MESVEENFCFLYASHKSIDFFFLCFEKPQK